jgi:hypothetical protein
VISAHGIGHDNLVRSLEAEGNLEAQNIEFRDFDFAGMIPAANLFSAPSLRRFALARGSFRVGGEAIEVPRLELQSPRWGFLAEGRVDFSHALNFKIYPVLRPAAPTLASTSPESFSIRGTVEAPQLLPETSAAVPAVRGGGARR